MAKKRQSGLGKGLDSLIPDIYNEDFDSNTNLSLEDILSENSNKEETEVIEEPIEEGESEKSSDLKVEEESLDEEESDLKNEEKASEEDSVEIEDDEDDKEISDDAHQDESETPQDEEILETSQEISDNEENQEEIVLTEKEIAHIEEVKEIVAKNPRITLWSSQSAAVFRYLRKTEPEFSISKEASILIDEAVSKKYPDIWKLFEED